MPGTLILVRHGQSTWNLQNLFTGWTDVDLTDQGRAVLASVAAGELAPGQGAQLLTAIGTLARVTEIDELAARVAALEEKHHAKP